MPKGRGVWKARYDDEYGNQGNKDNRRVQACS